MPFHLESQYDEVSEILTTMQGLITNMKYGYGPRWERHREQFQCETEKLKALLSKI